MRLWVWSQNQIKLWNQIKMVNFTFCIFHTKITSAQTFAIYRQTHKTLPYAVASLLTAIINKAFLFWIRKHFHWLQKLIKEQALANHFNIGMPHPRCGTSHYDAQPILRATNGSCGFSVLLRGSYLIWKCCCRSPRCTTSVQYSMNGQVTSSLLRSLLTKMLDFLQRCRSTGWRSTGQKSFSTRKLVRQRVQ